MNQIVLNSDYFFVCTMIWVKLYNVDFWMNNLNTENRFNTKIKLIPNVFI